jgi:transposase
VKGYVKRSKNDAADAAAICEAVTRPSMRFVPIKSTDQQALLMSHRTTTRLWVMGVKARAIDWDLIRELHQGQRSWCRANRPDT